MTNKYTPSSVFVNISPILTNDYEYRVIQLLYDDNQRMRRIVFEIEKHFIQEKCLLKSSHFHSKQNIEILKIEVSYIGDFEDFLYKLEFKKLYTDTYYVGDRTWTRKFKDLIEYTGALPHFKKSFFTESNMIIKNVDQLREQ